ncbi:Gfo/Idh/MocA family oxidoreductase [Ruminococcaceae bacterium OttesenSCG-928-A11]|nr:Gfo/Idh/MocA family oxidoreductase [Ruminococcaceae bacterium OttesenSCG-928-A11]
MQQKLRVGVISCSPMARSHMRAVARHPGAILQAVCDIDRARMDEAADELAVPHRFENYRQMLAAGLLDAVIIVTPDQLHREMTLAALDAGLHVLCEKPMALTLDDCRAMVRADDASDKKVMIGQICRYTPGFAAAKALIDCGEIGKLFFVESEYAHDYAHMEPHWRMDPLRHGFLGGGCHAVDLLRWVAGDPTEVMAYANHTMLPNWPTDDCTVAIMKFPQNVIGKVFVSTGCKRGYTMRSAFYGSRGTIITDNTNPQMRVFKTGMGDPLLAELGDSCAAPVLYPVALADHNTEGEFNEFADAILNDAPVRTTTREGAGTVAACLAAIQSAKSGVPVRPSYDF